MRKSIIFKAGEVHQWTSDTMRNVQTFFSIADQTIKTPFTAKSSLPRTAYKASIIRKRNVNFPRPYGPSSRPLRCKIDLTEPCKPRFSVRPTDLHDGDFPDGEGERKWLNSDM